MNMSKKELTRPVMIILYGFPGSGKTYFARQLCNDLKAAHIQDDKIRSELFEKPVYSREENQIVNNLMNYMTEEFSSAGISIIYDTNTARISQRRALRELAAKNKVEDLMVWLQIDIESSFSRVVKRDRRKIDDKYASPMDRSTFEKLVHNMQNPTNTEKYIVLSGKHSYTTQKNMIFKRFVDMGLIIPNLTDNKSPRPGMVNIIPGMQSGRVDSSRRNIFIR